MTDRPSEKAMRECWSCIHKQSIPGDAHIRCGKPDPQMTGSAYGRSQGWFFYPWNFDPVWKTKECVNFEEKPNAKR